MRTKFIEAESDQGNWGKFAVGFFDDEEWGRPSAVAAVAVEELGLFSHTMPLLAEVGWTHNHVLVLDLQTGEGAVMLPGGHAPADLNKHRVWVCPLFEPFLEWLWTQRCDPDTLPDMIKLTGVPLQLSGYRRPGPDGD